MTKEVIQQALDAIPTQAILHVSGLLVTLKVYKRDYVTHAKDEPLIKLSDALAAVTAIESAIAQPTQSSALSKLLFEIDTQAGNGFIPWQIEDAYAEYIASVAQPEQPAAQRAPVLPPLEPHEHPEPRTMRWTELEMRFIREYALTAIAATKDTP